MEYIDEVLLRMQLTYFENQLDEVEVVCTGCRKISKERASASFEFYLINTTLDQL
ncbi:hypothetical protein MUK51_07905 [Sphingobacterium faecium]|uniref:hypothetical protein n=1 Tax=Sphingobacterium faecium TaxID=34087 RepID=UPI0021B5E3FA|nr:hypothetical protein [Sphingobacterium faecium]UXD71207.1 hypothetical protein MUK51_07905 [Sphingobacterium faecium]